MRTLENFAEFISTQNQKLEYYHRLLNVVHLSLNENLAELLDHQILFKKFTGRDASIQTLKTTAPYLRA
jgi:hypothetical protein